MRKFIFSIVLIGVCYLIYRSKHFTKQDVVGTYSHEGAPPGTQLIVRSDGTFSGYTGRPVGSGRWKLVDSEYLISGTGIEFDGGSGPTSYADEYPLTRRDSHVCYEVMEDEEYWCRE